jgi:multiple sugar transport system permease protein
VSVAPRSNMGQRLARRLLTYVLLGGFAVVFLSPILFMIVASLKPDEDIMSQAGSWRALFPGEVGLENYHDVFERVPFDLYLFNSVLVNGSIVILGLVVNSLAGYALARLRWPGREKVLAAVLAILVIPFEAIAVPLFYQLTTMGWQDTYWVQVAPFIANPLSIYLFYSFFLGLPKSLEEAAQVDGAGSVRSFVSIVAPNSKPVFASVAIVTLLFFWGVYLWPLLMTAGPNVRPLPLGIATFYTLPPLQWGDIMAFGVMMVAPIVVVFLLFQRWFAQGVAASGLKG